MNAICEDRARGAIWGQLLGDAACLGAHWIYDLDDLHAKYPVIHGFEAPLNGHYHSGRKSGDQTHYGDAALVMLESVSRLGHFNTADFGARFIEFFGAADYHGYRDHSTRETLANWRKFQDEHPEQPFDYQQGADDDQLAMASRLAPVVVAHLNDPDLLEIVTKATRVTQNNRLAVTVMHANALILRALLLGKELTAALEETGAQLPGIDPKYGPELQTQITTAMNDRRSVQEATLAYGQSCPLPNSFPAAIQAAVKHSDSFAEGVLETLKAGGDNAGRAALVGAWLGASLGFKGIPETWPSTLSVHSTVQFQVEDLLRQLRTPAK